MSCRSSSMKNFIKSVLIKISCLKMEYKNRPLSKDSGGSSSKIISEPIISIWAKSTLLSSSSLTTNLKIVKIMIRQSMKILNKRNWSKILKKRIHLTMK